MRKTLEYLAVYLNKIIVPKATSPYVVKPEYLTVSSKEDIYKGVTALRAFLCQIFDKLAAKGNQYDNGKKVAHEYENRTTLSGYYPFLHNINIMLIRIGYYGVLSDNKQSLSCINNVFSDKISVTKTLECLQFLAECGLNIEGLDINDKKQKLSDVSSMKITYPDNPDMLIGLKVMAIAEIDHRTLLNQDVLLRCDYKILKKDETDVLTIVEDTIKPLSQNMQKFVLELHEHYIGKGLTCTVEVKGFYIYIMYSYKRKVLWGLNASLNNGYHINVKPLKTNEYADIIRTLNPALQKTIAKGYGCGRKNDVGHCDGGCRGLIIPLDDSALGMKDDIITWFDTELLYLGNK